MRAWRLGRAALKVPILLTLYDESAAGRLDLNTPAPVSRGEYAIAVGFEASPDIVAAANTADYVIYNRLLS